jgi:hypothetical protein
MGGLLGPKKDEKKDDCGAGDPLPPPIEATWLSWVAKHPNIDDATRRLVRLAFECGYWAAKHAK